MALNFSVESFLLPLLIVFFSAVTVTLISVFVFKAKMRADLS